MHKLVSYGSAIIFFVIGAIFAAVFYFHLQGSSFSYGDITVSERPGSATSRVVIQGMDTDGPLKDFASKFNKHVGELNHQRAEETRLLLLLDVVGALAAFLAGGLELLRPLLAKENAA